MASSSWPPMGYTQQREESCCFSFFFPPLSTSWGEDGYSGILPWDTRKGGLPKKNFICFRHQGFLPSRHQDSHYASPLCTVYNIANNPCVCTANVFFIVKLFRLGQRRTHSRRPVILVSRPVIASFQFHCMCSTYTESAFRSYARVTLAMMPREGERERREERDAASICKRLSLLSPSMPVPSRLHENPRRERGAVSTHVAVVCV